LFAVALLVLLAFFVDDFAGDVDGAGIIAAFHRGFLLHT
jgi:hypothetical protein